MSLLWYSGFDYLATAQLTRAGITYSGADIVTGGRGGGNCLWVGNTDTLAYVIHASTATAIYGMAAKFSSGLTFSQNVPFAIAMDGATAQVSLTIDSTTRNIVVKRGSIVIATGTAVIVPDAWYYIEWKVKINDTTGSSVVRVNSVEDSSVSSVDTQVSGNAVANQLYWHGNVRYDDVYICDGQGAGPDNDFLGDVSCQMMLPSGNGSSSQWTGSDGNSVDNFQLVDDASPDDDTTYVKSGTVGEKDLYDYGSIAATSGTIYAVQPLLYARKDDAGLRKICSVARLSGGTESDSADHSIGETYQYWSDIRTTKPGGGAWSVTDVNGATFGVKVTA